MIPSLNQVSQSSASSSLQQGDYLRAVVESFLDGVIAIDHQGVVQSVNPAVTRMLGFQADELIGQSVSRIMPEAHRKQHGETLRQNIVTGKRVITGVGREVVAVRKDGSPIPVHLTVTEFEQEGRPSFVGVIRDLSVQYHQQALLHAASVEAEQASNARMAFLRNMSHEFRTPLTAILGYSELLQDDLNDPELREGLQTIHRHGMVLLHTISNLLDMTALESGCVQLHCQPCHVPTIVSSLQRRYLDEALAKQLSLYVHTDAAVQTCWAEPCRLEQVLGNLISNAIKFTDRGAITLQVDRVVRESVRFRIIDTGIGIASADADRLFQPMTQLDMSTSRERGGAGLGLALSRTLAELMHGQLYCQSVPGEGSTFTLELPADQPAADPQSNSDSSTDVPDFESRPLPSADRPQPLLSRVLLAEDNPVTSRLLERLLTRHGAEVTCVGDGFAAIREALLSVTGQRSFDVILMDWQMPKMTGVEATRRIRAHGIKIPIVAISAHVSNEDQQTFFAAGGNDYICKPFQAAGVLAKVAVWTKWSAGLAPDPISSHISQDSSPGFETASSELAATHQKVD
jgi:PAS domain S-box-containing protein